MSLSDTIAATLRDAGASSDVAAVLADAKAEAAKLDRVITTARADAMNPLAGAEAVGAARDVLADATFTRERLTVALSALAERVEHLGELERKAATDAEREAATAERDKLAEAIRSEVPGMVRRWTELVRLIRANDARLAAAGVAQSAESIARDYPTHGQWPNSAGPVMRMRDAKLPLFFGHGLAWADTPNGPVWPGAEA